MVGHTLADEPNVTVPYRILSQVNCYKLTIRKLSVLMSVQKTRTRQAWRKTRQCLKTGHSASPHLFLKGVKFFPTV